MKKWIIKNQIYLFPKDWNKQKIINFCNQEIRVCPICEKVDIPLNHFNNCNGKKQNI